MSLTVRFNENFLGYFELDGLPAVIDGEEMCFGERRVPIRNGIPRFTPDSAYTDNFALLRDRHSRLQLDSLNGTSDRRDTLLRRTGWPAEFFRGKTVLECGCGAGPDTEIMLDLGANVLSVDLAGSDRAQANIGIRPASQFVQASIMELPLRKRAFDIVFCHRVLQHTPAPRRTLEHLLQYVKPDGAVFMHSYSSSWHQRLRWKYALLPLTNKLPPRLLYCGIGLYARPLFHFTNFTGRTRIGRRFNWIFVPLLNYSSAAKFRGLDSGRLLEYAIHDTFDALSPRYDSPLTQKTMRDVATRMLGTPFEIVDDRTVTLLRTLVGSRSKA